MLVRHNARLELSGQTAAGLIVTQLEEMDTDARISSDRIELIKLLRLAGGSCDQLATKIHDFVVTQLSSQNYEAVPHCLRDLENTLNEPLTMKQLARMAVRRELGCELLHLKNLLPIPTMLQDYLLMPNDVRGHSSSTSIGN